MDEEKVKLLTDHFLILGIGGLADSIIENLTGEGINFCIIANDLGGKNKLKKEETNIFIGDPSEEEILKKVGINDAKAVLVATNDDAQDVLTIITARYLNPDVRIIAGATNRENIKKLKRAGADEVISPASIGGRLLVKSALDQN